MRSPPTSFLCACEWVVCEMKKGEGEKEGEGGEERERPEH